MIVGSVSRRRFPGLVKLAVGFALILYDTIVFAQVIQNAVGSPFSMFTQQNFTAWELRGNANWQFVDEQVVMNQGDGWLVSRLSLQDFVIEMTYWTSTDTQVSLFLRCSDPRSIRSDTAYELRLSGSAVGGYGVGSFVGHYRAPPSIKTNGYWKAVKVTATGSYLSVWIDGVKVVDDFYDPSSSRGPVALHSHGGAFRIGAFNLTIPGRW